MAYQDKVSGVTPQSEEDFAYYLWGVPASEIGTLLTSVCKRENRKFRNAGKRVVCKYVGDLLGTQVTVLTTVPEYFDGKVGLFSSMTVEYDISTIEWEIKLKADIFHNSYGVGLGGFFAKDMPRGMAKIDGHPAIIYDPIFEGDVPTYQAEMSIIRMMMPMLMDEAA